MRSKYAVCDELYAAYHLQSDIESEKAVACLIENKVFRIGLN
jgi:hypothetical protein